MAIKVFTDGMNSSDKTYDGATAYEFLEQGLLELTYAGGKVVTLSSQAWFRLEVTP